MKHLNPFAKSSKRVNIIRLSGAIMTRQGGLNDAALAPTIERAFSKGKPAAVALLINSPGGAPVQTSLMAARIRRLAAEKQLPVFAFVEDVAASGGYWLACAADEIYVDDNSIVGSIGVISSSFGFDQLIAKHGIERRVYTSGTSKSQLDPFQPENPEDISRLKSLQGEIHANFIAYVQKARGDKLTTETELFDGRFWTGAKSVELGLVDGVGHLVPKLKEMFGEKTRFAVFGPKKPLLKRFSAQVSDGLVAQMRETTHWARFGL